MLTPIFLQYQPGFLPITSGPTPSPSPNALTLGNPYYTLTISSPHNPNQTGLLSYQTQQIRIPNSQIVRIQLPSTVGFGVNSAYEVTYTVYRDITSPLQTYYPPQKKVIRTEYWRVPNVLGHFYDNYSEIEDSLLNLSPALEILSVVRGTTDLDELSGDELKAFAIHRIYQEGLDYTTFQVVPTGIEWISEERPAEGSTYYIQYLKPFEMKDIVYIPRRDDYTLIKTVKNSLESQSYIVRERNTF